MFQGTLEATVFSMSECKILSTQIPFKNNLTLMQYFPPEILGRTASHTKVKCH